MVVRGVVVEAIGFDWSVLVFIIGGCSAVFIVIFISIAIVQTFIVICGSDASMSLVGGGSCK